MVTLPPDWVTEPFPPGSPGKPPTVPAFPAPTIMLPPTESVPPDTETMPSRTGLFAGPAGSAGPDPTVRSPAMVAVDVPDWVKTPWPNTPIVAEPAVSAPVPDRL